MYIYTHYLYIYTHVYGPPLRPYCRRGGKGS